MWAWGSSCAAVVRGCAIEKKPPKPPINRPGAPPPGRARSRAAGQWAVFPPKKPPRHQLQLGGFSATKTTQAAGGLVGRAAWRSCARPCLHVHANKPPKPPRPPSWWRPGRRPAGRRPAGRPGAMYTRGLAAAWRHIYPRPGALYTRECQTYSTRYSLRVCRVNPYSVACTRQQGHAAEARGQGPARSDFANGGAAQIFFKSLALSQNVLR